MDDTAGQPRALVPTGWSGRALVRTFIVLTFGTFFPGLPMVGAQVLLTQFQDSAPKYYEAEGQPQGICVDLIDSLNSLLTADGITIEPYDRENPFVPFRRLQANLESGSIDVFIGLARTPERLEKFLFLDDPAYIVRSTFAKPVESDFEYRATGDLRGMTIGVVSGSKTAGQLVEMGGLDLIHINTIEQAIRALGAGRLDLVFYHSLGLGHTIRELDLADSVVLIERNFEVYGHYIAFHAGVDESVREKVAGALDRLWEDGSIDEIVASYNVQGRTD